MNNSILIFYRFKYYTCLDTYWFPIKVYFEFSGLTNLLSTLVCYLALSYYYFHGFSFYFYLFLLIYLFYCIFITIIIIIIIITIITFLRLILIDRKTR